MFWMGVFLVFFVPLVLVVLPFLRRIHDHGEGWNWQEEQGNLLSQMADLEYDYHMQKLGKQDYDELKRDLHRRFSAFMAEGKALEADLRNSIASEVERRVKEG